MESLSCNCKSFSEFDGKFGKFVESCVKVEEMIKILCLVRECYVRWVKSLEVLWTAAWDELNVGKYSGMFEKEEWKFVEFDGKFVRFGE